MRPNRFSLLLCAALAACGPTASPAPQDDARPALWEITDQTGAAEGWLFGTIHALPDGVSWRSDPLETALARADLLVVEVANLGDGAAIGKIFAAMAYDRAEEPLAQRVAPAHRDDLARLLARPGVDGRALDRMESWAAALVLAQLAQQSRAENGVDRALIAGFEGREVIELEGAQAQLGLFDALAPADQRDMLNAVLEETADYEAEIALLAGQWRKGDLEALGEMTTRGILADAELRKALLTDRNAAWAGRIENLLTADAKPFVAVGAGHLLGPEGLPALIAAHGYRVRRIQ